MYRPSYRNREELPSPAVKKEKRAIYSDPSNTRRIMAEIKKEFPQLDAGSEKNLIAIFSFLQDEDAVGGFTLENVRVAVAALSYPEEKLERVPLPSPPPPPPPAPTEPEEVLRPGQLSIHATRQELEKASPAQIRDYLKRLRAHQK